MWVVALVLLLRAYNSLPVLCVCTCVVYVSVALYLGYRYPATGPKTPAFKEFRGHSSHVMNCRWSPDSQTVVPVGGNDRCVLGGKVHVKKCWARPPTPTPTLFHFWLHLWFWFHIVGLMPLHFRCVFQWSLHETDFPAVAPPALAGAGAGAGAAAGAASGVVGGTFANACFCCVAESIASCLCTRPTLHRRFFFVETRNVYEHTCVVVTGH